MISEPGFRFSERNGHTLKFHEKSHRYYLKKKDEALKWLVKHGFEHLIKRNINVEFGRNEYKWAKKFHTDMNRRKHPLRFEDKETVHPKTLSAFVNEQMEAGKQIPKELFQAIQIKKTDITLPKK